MPAQVVSLAGRDGFGRNSNVYGFDFGGSTTNTYNPANHVYQRPTASPSVFVQSPAAPQTQPGPSRPKRGKVATWVRNFYRRLWTERHQQSEAQKRRAKRLERHFAEHMFDYLLGAAG